MLNKGIDTMTAALETVVSKVEQLDQTAQTRPAVFGSGSKDSKIEEIEVAGSDEQKGVLAVDRGKLEKLKVVTSELLDIWLFEGSRGLRYLQESTAYKLTDPYVNYVETYQSVKDKSLSLTKNVASKIKELNQNVVLFYDETTNFVGLLLKVLSDRQETLIAYVRKTYSNVTIFVKDNWLRLDFNADGVVTMDDMRTGLTQFYEFLKSFDYIEATTRIKSTIYDEAKRLVSSSAAQSDKAEEIPITEVASNITELSSNEIRIEEEINEVKQSLINLKIDETGGSEKLHAHTELEPTVDT